MNRPVKMTVFGAWQAAEPVHGITIGASREHRRGRLPFRRWLAIGTVLSALLATAPTYAGDVDRYEPIIAEAADRFAIPAQWIGAVIVAESAADPRAVSPKGAMGLMQIMPATWDELRVQHGLGPDPFLPANNILAGTAYLRQMLDRYGSVALMLAAYNAGPGRVDAHLTTGKSLPRETIQYVAGLMPRLSGAAGEVSFAMPAAPSAQPPANTLFVPRTAVRNLTPKPGSTEPTADVDPTADNPLFVSPKTGQRR